MERQVSSWFHFHEVFKIVKFKESKSGMVVATGSGEGKNGELLIEKRKISAKPGERALELCSTTLYLESAILCWTLKSLRS